MHEGSMWSIPRKSALLPIPSLFFIALCVTMGFKDATAFYAPAPRAGKPRPDVYAVLQVVRRAGVSTPDAYHKEAAQFKNATIVYPVMKDPQVLRLRVIKEQ